MRSSLLSRLRFVRRRALVCIFLLTASCGGIESSIGTEDPIRIREGTHRAGPLPGTRAPDGGALVSPSITSIETANAVITIGQAGKVLTGRTSTDAYAVGIAFLDLDMGHWVLPVGPPDPTLGGEYTFSATADFGRDLPPGLHTIGFVAIDSEGRAGTQATLSVCVLPDVPDNFNACDPSTFAPPEAVISLAWSNDVDLDLVVVTPSGKVVSAKNPTTYDVDGGAVPSSGLADPATGILTRDSNRDCSLDGVRRESLVFQGAPRSGTYLVYANLHRACGQLGTDFRLSIHRAIPNDAGGRSLERTELAGGKLLALQANGGAALGTYVTSVTFP